MKVIVQLEKEEYDKLVDAAKRNEEEINRLAKEWSINLVAHLRKMPDGRCSPEILADFIERRMGEIRRKEEYVGS